MLTRGILVLGCLYSVLLAADGGAPAQGEPETDGVSIVHSMREARKVGVKPTSRERHLRDNYSSERLANEFGIL